MLSKHFYKTHANNGEISDTPELLYEQAIDDFINDTNNQSPFYEDFYRLLAHLDNDINRVKSLLSSMLTRREQWLNILLASELIKTDTTHSKALIESGFKALFSELQQRLSTLLHIDQNQFILNQILAFCDNQYKEILIGQDNTIFW